MIKMMLTKIKMMIIIIMITTITIIIKTTAGRLRHRRDRGRLLDCEEQLGHRVGAVVLMVLIVMIVMVLVVVMGLHIFKTMV